MKTIFEHTDFREYLKAYYEHRKKNTRYFTYRYFSQKAGFKSPNQLQLIIQGKRNLTERAFFRCAEALGLNPAETEYFRDMVGYGQAKTIPEKDYHYQKLMNNKNCANIKVLDKDCFDFLANWKHGAVREMIAIMDFRGDYEKLAKNIQPAITSAQAKKSVALLERFGLIKKEADGRYVQTTGAVEPSRDVRRMALVKFHREMLSLSRDVLAERPSEEFNISGVTLGVSARTRDKIQAEIDAFRKKVLNMAAEESEPERVYQLNLQLFPLSKKDPEKQ